MNTKTCKFCGWVYPITQPGLRCKICGQPFDMVRCDICEEVFPVDMMIKDRVVCKRCKNTRSRRNHSAQMAAMEKSFNEWLDKIKQVPKNYPTLSEEQWLEACTFFGGCARCGKDDIDTRGFFVGAKLGGRYCDWNIIPLCEKCANAWDLEQSAFRYIERRKYTDKTPEYHDCLIRIVEYLGGKLDDATRTTE